MANASNVDSLLPTCSACHGSNGVSSADIWPNLAGQKKAYMVAQLKAFREGTRVEPQMNAMVANLSDDDIDAISSHYAQQKRPAPTNTDVNATGANILGANVRARCISCHGRGGETVNDEWPNLAGQKASYLKQQLLNYKSGKRVNTSMQVIASELSEKEIEAVAEFFSQQ